MLFRLSSSKNTMNSYVLFAVVILYLALLFLVAHRAEKEEQDLGEQSLHLRIVVGGLLYSVDVLRKYWRCRE